MRDRRSWLAFESSLFRYDPVEWLILTGDRILVSALQVAVLVAILAGVVTTGLVPLAAETPVLFLLFALIAANFTLIAIVTSLGQFILSRRLESPGEIRTAMAETIDYREDVGEFTDRITDQLGRLAATLEHIVVAVRMFEAVFIEAEVSELARYLLYVGLPVQVAAMVVMLLYTAPGGTPLLPETTLTVLVPAVIVAGFTPFLILASYIVRLTVVARRTADTFPFSSQLTRTVALRDAFTRDDR